MLVLEPNTIENLLLFFRCELGVYGDFGWMVQITQDVCEDIEPVELFDGRQWNILPVR